MQETRVRSDRSQGRGEVLSDGGESLAVVNYNIAITHEIIVTRSFNEPPEELDGLASVRGSFAVVSGPATLSDRNDPCYGSMTARRSRLAPSARRARLITGSPTEPARSCRR